MSTEELEDLMAYCDHATSERGECIADLADGAASHRVGLEMIGTAVAVSMEHNAGRVIWEAVAMTMLEAGIALGRGYERQCRGRAEFDRLVLQEGARDER